MAIPFLFWFVSGLFFAIAPIEQVRSEHMKAAAPVADVFARREVGSSMIETAGPDVFA